MVYDGTVVNVRRVAYGTFLTAGADVGGTTLDVEDAAEFNEDGGTLLLDGDEYAYTTVDMDEDTVTLAAPLPQGYADEAEVLVYPLVFERVADVVVEDDDEAMSCRVTHSLYDKLPEGLREPWAQESVAVYEEAGELVVREVFGSEPLVDGSFIDPTSEIPAEALPPIEVEPPPPVPPEAVPTPDATGVIRKVLLDLPPVVTTSGYRAEVYVSTTTPVTVTPENLHGVASGVKYSLDALPDGTLLTALPPGTVIYVVVRAVNDAGEGPTSGEVSATLQAVDAEEFAATFFYGAVVRVEDLRGDLFSLGEGTVSKIEAHGANGEIVGMAAVDYGGMNWRGAWNAATAYAENDAVSYSGAWYRRRIAGTTATAPNADTTNWEPAPEPMNGFYSLGERAADGSRPVRVHFPVDGKPNIVSGQSEFDTLKVNESTTFDGPVTISPGERVTLQGSVQAPKVKPTVTVDWHTVQQTQVPSETTQHGLTRGVDSVNTTPGWYSARVWDDGLGEVDRFNDDGSFVQTFGLAAPGFSPLGGIVYASHHSGRFYLLVQHQTTGDWYVEARDTTFTLVAGAGGRRQVLNANDVDRVPTIGWDHIAGAPLVGYPDGDTLGQGELLIRTLQVDANGFVASGAPAGWAASTLWQSDYIYDYDLGFVTRCTTEHGGRYVFRAIARASDDDNFQVFTTGASPTRQTAEQWPRAGSSYTRGGWWDGTRFWSLATNGQRYRYETGRCMWTSGSAVREVQTSLKRTGSHETTPSPKASVTLPKRARLSVTFQAIPIGDGGAAFPNAARVYVGVGSGVANGSMNLEKTVAAPGTSWSLDSSVAQESATTHPPTVNGFPAANPSGVDATSGGFTVDSSSNGSVGTGTFRDSIYPAWTTYTPTVTTGNVAISLGNGTIDGRYAKVGKRVDFTIVFTIGSTTNLGTSASTMRFGLPFTARGANHVVVLGISNAPNGQYVGRADLGGGTTNDFLLNAVGQTATLSPGSSGWASGTTVRFSGTYEST